jgi:flagellar protein FliJ
MKKFHFSLDGALRLRRVGLRSAEVKLKELIAQEQRIRRSIQAIAVERRDANAYIEQHPGDIPALRALPPYLLGLEMRRANLNKSLETVAGSVRHQQAIVAEFERVVKLLEKLRQRRVAEWQKEMDREIEALAQESWLAAHADTRKPRDC